MKLAREKALLFKYRLVLHIFIIFIFIEPHTHTHTYWIRHSLFIIMYIKLRKPCWAFSIFFFFLIFEYIIFCFVLSWLLILAWSANSDLVKFNEINNHNLMAHKNNGGDHNEENGELFGQFGIFFFDLSSYYDFTGLARDCNRVCLLYFATWFRLLYIADKWQGEAEWGSYDCGSLSIDIGRCTLCTSKYRGHLHIWYGAHMHI